MRVSVYLRAITRTTASGSYAEQNREIISCEGLPDYIGNAIVASENRTFYTDKGLDLKGIARAFINNVTKGTRQGGSTITQQYAERYYMGETTSYVGKAREAIMAIKIAQTESKDEVLCNYMNTIYLGRNSYGIQAAAKAYFNKDAKDLTLSEAAMIAGIIPSPSTWDPADNADMAKSRFKRVLNIMQEDGYMTVKVQTPCLITCIKELNEPRYMSVGGVYESFKKPIAVFDFNTLKDDPLIDLTTIGLKGSPTNIFKSFTPPPKGVGQMLEGADKATCEGLAETLAAKHII